MYRLYVLVKMQLGTIELTPYFDILGAMAHYNAIKSPHKRLYELRSGGSLELELFLVRDGDLDRELPLE